MGASVACLTPSYQMSYLRTFLVALLLKAHWAIAVWASGADVDYRRDIKPLLRDKCIACHGALHQEAGLRLDAAKLIRKGGDDGAVITMGDPSRSRLIDRVTTRDSDLQMPPEGEGERLRADQVKLLKQWINDGAHAPSDEAIPNDPKQHWAYQQPSRISVSEPDNDEWLRNPIDAFVFSQHQKAGITATSAADKPTLVRRVYLDLIGLPPTPDQMEDFLRDESMVAYHRLVEKLLASPQYGERWGRHWMDVWRYSDWAGYKQQLRESQRHIWRWRDWIVDSLNEDKGYDRMIVEMLAGDELAPEDLDVVRATGFLARNYHKSNRNIWLDATVEHTAKAFLALTINCARCHDHKFDPISQNDYYAMRAIFEPHNVRTERLPGQPSLKVDGLPRAYDSDLNAQTFLYVRGNEKHFDKDSPIVPELPTVFDQTLDPKPVELPPIAVFPSLRSPIEAEEILGAEKKVRTARRSLELLEKKTGDQTSPDIVVARQKVDSFELGLRSLRARWAADRAKYAHDNNADLKRLTELAANLEREDAVMKANLICTEKYQRLVQSKASEEANIEKKQAAINKAKQEYESAKKQLATAEKAVSNNDAKYTSVGDVYPEQSTGRRLALANWIISPKNPLTARVAVNHLWLRHFGQPLVANTFDFGLRSPRPKYADLLDWLAVELMDNRWSLKHIHRLIVNSRTYQLSSSASPGLTAVNAVIDPDNQLFWRANVRRLDAEVIRDSLLYVAGSLDNQMFGPDIDHAKGQSVFRRSLYFQHAYEKQMTMLVLFDAAGPNECYRRSESVIPQQALTLANSTLSVSQARKLANQLCGTLTRDRRKDSDGLTTLFIRLAFQQTLSRSASLAEIAMCRDFLERQSELLADPESLTEFSSKSSASVAAAKDPELRAMQNLIHVLMNHNDFVTVR